MIFFGVPLGANRPAHNEKRSRGNPVSSTDGISGAIANRFLAVTTKALMLPARTCDGDVLCCCLRSADRRYTAGHDDIDFRTQEIANQRGYRFDVIAIVAKLVGNVAPFDITEVAHPAHEFLAVWIVVRGSRSDVSDARGLTRLLRTRRERPCDCRAAKCGQQFPPSDDDCHTPLPCEVRKAKNTTPRACCPTSAAPSADSRRARSTATPPRRRAA